MLVINLGPQTLVTDIEKNSRKGIRVVDSLTLPIEMAYTPESWQDFFQRLAAEYSDLEELPLHLVLDTKMGVLYKTFSVTIDVFADIERQRKQASNPAEAQEILHNFLLKQLPVGLSSYYVPSIPRSVSRPQDVLVTCAYVPQRLIASLVEAANREGLQIFDMVPGLRALYGAFDSSSALGLQLPAANVLLMHFGALVWTKPDNWAEENNDCIDDYFKEKLKLFDLSNLEEAVMVNQANMGQYLNQQIDLDSLLATGDPLTAALCCGAAVNPDYKDKKEAGYVLNRIRQFFK